MNNNGPRIIKPGHVSLDPKVSRLLLLIDENKKLAQANYLQAETIKTMNKFLTEMAGIVGSPLPQNVAEGQNAIDIMKARIAELVEKEKLSNESEAI